MISEKLFSGILNAFKIPEKSFIVKTKQTF